MCPLQLGFGVVIVVVVSSLNISIKKSYVNTKTYKQDHLKRNSQILSEIASYI